MTAVSLISMSDVLLQFIAHPHCQSTMKQEWSADIPECMRDAFGFSKRNFVYILLWIISWPVWPVLYLVAMFNVPRQLIAFMRAPYNRLISDTISFVIFFALLLANATSVRQDIGEPRASVFSYIEWSIIIWVVGMTVRLFTMAVKCHQMLKVELEPSIFNWRWYAKFLASLIVSKWRWFEKIMLLCFWLWIGLQALGFKLTPPKPRYLWPNEDLTLIGEVCYAVGVWVSVIHLNSLCVVHPKLGPLHISLKEMVGGIVRFCVIFVIVMSAFVLAIMKVYGSYSGSVTLAPDGTVIEEQQDSFIG
jgi:hypothetical protein